MSMATAIAKPETFASFDDLEALVRGFERGTLSREAWTHEAHLAVAGWYLVCYPEPEAVERIRAGILRFNDAVGIVTTKDSGYHETMTLFWARMVRACLRAEKLDCTLVELVNAMIGRLRDRKLPFEYYSRERLLSWEARREWVEPDVKPLPVELQAE